MRQVLERFIRQPCRRVVRAFLGVPGPLAKSYSGNSESVLQCCVSYNEHGGYCVPLASLHRPAAQRILSGDVWERETLTFIARNIGNGDVIHAGTYFGDFLPALSRLCVAGARVWAFEPNPENCRCASITRLINNLDNVELMNAALGAAEGCLPMIISDESGKALGGASRLVEEERRASAEEIAKVRVGRLDDVLPPNANISVLQLDVEGFEQPALAGSMHTIRRCKPILILENLPEADWVAANLRRLGYRRAGEVHGNAILVCD